MTRKTRTITYRIDEDKHRQLKLAAVQTGRTLKDLLDDAVEHVLKEYQQEIQDAQGKQ